MTKREHVYDVLIVFRFFEKNVFCDLNFKIFRPDTSEPPRRLQLKNVSISSVFHCFF